MADSPGATTDLEVFLDAELDGLARLAAVLTADSDDAAALLAAATESVAAGWHRTTVRTDRLRYARRLMVISYLGDRRADGQDTDGGDDDTDDGAGPGDTRPAAGAVGAALSGLRHRELAALVLRDHLELSEGTGRAVLGVSVGVYRSRLASASSRVREEAELTSDAVNDDDLRARIAAALRSRERYVPTDLAAPRAAALQEATSRSRVRPDTTGVPLLVAALIAVVVLVVVLLLTVL